MKLNIVFHRVSFFFIFILFFNGATWETVRKLEIRSLHSARSRQPMKGTGATWNNSKTHVHNGKTTAKNTWTTIPSPLHTKWRVIVFAFRYCRKLQWSVVCALGSWPWCRCRVLLRGCCCRVLLGVLFQSRVVRVGFKCTICQHTGYRIVQCIWVPSCSNRRHKDHSTSHVHPFITETNTINGKHCISQHKTGAQRWMTLVHLRHQKPQWSLKLKPTIGCCVTKQAIQRMTHSKISINC